MGLEGRQLAAKRWALWSLTAASPLALAGFCFDFPGSEGLFAGLTVVIPVALMTLGAVRPGRGARALVIIGALFGLLLLVMLGLFATRGSAATSAVWAGLPAPAAVQIYGLFLAPLLISSLGYAWSFRDSGFTEDDLEALRRRFPGSLEIDEDRRAAGR